MKKIITTGILIATLLTTAVPVFGAETPTVTAISVDNKTDYTDITGTWFEKSAALYGYPEIFGSDKGTFEPNKEITRMEFARVLHKALGININYFVATDIADYFTDVKNEDIGASNLYDLVTANIIDRKGTFGANETLNRDEMVHYIINALKYKTGGQYALIKMMPAPFDDDAKIKTEYKNDIIEAVLLKIVNGRGNNLLFPDKGTTRAEAVTVVDRLNTLLASYEKTDVTVVANAVEKDGALHMLLTVKNNSDKPITIKHTSGQKFDFKVVDEKGESLYNWSADKMFMMMLTETVIGPGKTVEFTDTIPAETYAGIKDKAALLKAYITGTSDNFTIEADGYSADIRK